MYLSATFLPLNASFMEQVASCGSFLTVGQHSGDARQVQVDVERPLLLGICSAGGQLRCADQWPPLGGSTWGMHMRKLASGPAKRKCKLRAVQKRSFCKLSQAVHPRWSWRAAVSRCTLGTNRKSRTGGTSQPNIKCFLVCRGKQGVKGKLDPGGVVVSDLSLD